MRFIYFIIPGSNSTHMKLDIFLGNWLRHGLIAGGKVPRVPLRMSLRRRLKPQESYRKVLLVEVVFFSQCVLVCVSVSV